MTHRLTGDMEHGPQLVAFLRREWDARGVSCHAWCRQVGLEPSTVSRWAAGGEPKIESLRLVANGLHRPLVDVLHAAGFITDRERAGRSNPPPRPPPGMLAEAIAHDPSLLPEERQIYRLTCKLLGIRC